MFDGVIVATAGASGDILVPIGETLAAAFAGGTDPKVRTSLEQVRDVLKRKPGTRWLLLLDLELDDQAPPADGALGPCFDLVRSLQAEAAPPACLIFCAKTPPDLYRAVRTLPLCELLEPSQDLFADAERLVTRLDTLQHAMPEAPPPPEDAPYALLDVDVISDKALAILRLSIRGFDERQALVNFPDHEFKQLVEDSETLRRDLSDQLADKQIWAAHVGEWQRRYRELGARVGNLLHTREFGELYGAATAAAGRHARVRFSLDREGYDVCWEAMNGTQRWLAIDSTVTRRVTFRNGLPQAHLDAGDGTVRMLVIGSDPEPASPLDGPGDAQWELEWKDRTRFAPVRGLDDEQAMFAALEQACGVAGDEPVLAITTTTSRGRNGDYALKDEVEKLLAPVDGAGRRFDIVHFAGHAVFPRPDDPDARGYIVLAGKPYNYTLPLGTFARWLSRAGVRLAYLSCCSGSAARATFDLADNLIPMAIGFSWDLEGQGAARFAKTFYETLLTSQLKVCRAFQETKAAMYEDYRDGDPIWAAPVLITQPNDWSSVELCLGSARAA